MGAAHSQTNPERANGKPHPRGGEANTTTEIDTGSALVGPHGSYRLRLPNGWFDWSVFHLGGTDVEEETYVSQVPRTVRGEHHCVISLFPMERDQGNFPSLPDAHRKPIAQYNYDLPHRQSLAGPTMEKFLFASIEPYREDVHSSLTVSYFKCKHWKKSGIYCE